MDERPSRTGSNRKDVDQAIADALRHLADGTDRHTRLKEERLTAQPILLSVVAMVSAQSAWVVDYSEDTNTDVSVTLIEHYC